ncbi:hypothetical protein [Streptomyces sp. NPDC058953]|uniref:hypothetical protein n=1 Tax=unclassified Streptomyces TaxID=2593676 RepID=UPI0036C158C8
MEAQIHLSRAAALAGSGHPEGVMDALTPVLVLPVEHRLTTITRRVDELALHLSGHRSGAGSVSLAVRQALEEWCADSVRRRRAISTGDAPGRRDLER